MTPPWCRSPRGRHHCVWEVGILGRPSSRTAPLWRALCVPSFARWASRGRSSSVSSDAKQSSLSSWDGLLWGGREGRMAPGRICLANGVRTAFSVGGLGRRTDGLASWPWEKPVPRGPASPRPWGLPPQPRLLVGGTVPLGAVSWRAMRHGERGLSIFGWPVPAWCGPRIRAPGWTRATGRPTGGPDLRSRPTGQPPFLGVLPLGPTRGCLLFAFLPEALREQGDPLLRRDAFLPEVVEERPERRALRNALDRGVDSGGFEPPCRVGPGLASGTAWAVRCSWGPPDQGVLFSRPWPTSPCLGP